MVEDDFPLFAFFLFLIPMVGAVLWAFMYKWGPFDIEETKSVSGSVFALLFFSVLATLIAGLFALVWPGMMVVSFFAAAGVGLHKLREHLYKTGKLKRKLTLPRY